MMNDEINQQLEEIARQALNIETLKEQKSDDLDFHEVAVWQVKTALETAFIKGFARGTHEMVKKYA
tara:strand:+ start:4349 stop:4546 length:198 start_codon:yes stop_codon:yes gene_type:complete